MTAEELDAATLADAQIADRADWVRAHRRVCESNAGPLFQERDPDRERDEWINDGMGHEPAGR